MKYMHGLSHAEYIAMLKKQDGLCAICESVNSDGTRLPIDHNHNTGKIRALLCRACNALIGHAREKILILYKAADYIERHNR